MTTPHPITDLLYRVAGGYDPSLADYDALRGAGLPALGRSAVREAVHRIQDRREEDDRPGARRLAVELAERLVGLNPNLRPIERESPRDLAARVPRTSNPY